jgi:uncharacterized membrane protein
MKTREFLNRVNHEEIVRAIQAAETKTSGEMRVYVSRKEAPDPVLEGTRRFSIMGMHKTQGRNAVLFFVAPCSNTFAVIGDEAIHQKCGQEFWTRLAEEMTAFFKKGEFTQGLVKGIGTAGSILAMHFPRQPDDANELPDSVTEV